MTCPRYHAPGLSVSNPSMGGLSQCSKYNRYPMRALPMAGEINCQQPGASPENCWLDFRSCRKAEIARRVYDYATLGLRDRRGEPTVECAAMDGAGRRYYCLARHGEWVHDGDHEFTITDDLTMIPPPGEAEAKARAAAQNVRVV